MTTLRIATRSSHLAKVQTGNAVARLERLVPGLSVHIETCSSPGDRDRATDLRRTAPDFFTRDLDDAVRSGRVAAAVHSAKDVPPDGVPGLDWVWFPWGEDPRDAWVLAPGRSLDDLPEAPCIGVSSERRDTYARTRFPNARLAPIRGNIEDRLAQLDSGRYDALLMAAAALLRLDLADRITEWIPREALPTPEGQGRLCMTFRSGDPTVLRLRSLFMSSVTFVGAGAGHADHCTVAGMHALEHCEVCLHDALLDPALLEKLPPNARRIPVGKRAGAHSVPQETTTRLIADEARKGRRVVRLKGGDPGLFGRLAEETEVLDELGLPYRVLPGISSLSAATASTGILLTRRGVSPGFCVMTSRGKGGTVSDVSGAARTRLPCVFFMGTSVLDELTTQLLKDGMPPDTPAAVVFHAGADDERILRAPLSQLAAQLATHHTSHSASKTPPPGLILVGEIARYGFHRDNGALRNQRVLLTCSEALLDRAIDTVRDLGGRPVRFPLVRLAPDPAAVDVLARLHTYDWLVLTSPSAVRILLSMMKETGRDLRALPAVAVSGPPTADALRRHGLHAALCPTADFGGKGLLDAARQTLNGTRVLRLRSDLAGPDLGQALDDLGANVDDVVLYRNQPVAHGALPAFDAIFFASRSAVTAFTDQWGRSAWNGKLVAAIGQPTRQALQDCGCDDVIVPEETTVVAAIHALAGRTIADEIRTASCNSGESQLLPKTQPTNK